VHRLSSRREVLATLRTLLRCDTLFVDGEALLTNRVSRRPMLDSPSEVITPEG